MLHILCMIHVFSFWDAFFEVSGPCETDGNCVSSPNHPEIHGNNEACTMTMLRDAHVFPHEVFSIESGYDHLYINDVDITDSEQIPSRLNAGNQFFWESDGSVTNEGWKLCFEPGTLWRLWRYPYLNILSMWRYHDSRRLGWRWDCASDQSKITGGALRYF